MTFTPCLGTATKLEAAKTADMWPRFIIINKKLLNSVLIILMCY